jgi:rhodanese-related sulfurtransferase
MAQIKNPAFEKMLDSLYHKHVLPISINDFKKLDRQNVYLLDTREAREFAISHLKNARHVGYFWFDMRRVYDIPYESNIVVYCSIGNRADDIGDKLMNAGYQHVYNLYGGIFEWVNQGNPVYKVNGVQTSEVHYYGNKWAKWLERFQYWAQGIFY